MKLIDVSTPKFPNTFVQVDDEDFDALRLFRWYAVADHNTIYAVRKFRNTSGERKHTFLHNSIVVVPLGNRIDHIDHNGLNCQKHNLRLCTQSQNNQNRRKLKTATSKFKGVTWDKGYKKWRSRIRHNKKLLSLGVFSDEVKAAEAYDTAAKELFGEFANCNFGADRNL